MQRREEKFKSGVFLVHTSPVRRDIQVQLAEEDMREPVRERLKIYSVEEVPENDGEAS